MIYCLNLAFLPDLSLKWAERRLQDLSSLGVTPADLSLRLRSIFTDAPRVAADGLTSLIGDVLELVARTWPDLAADVLLAKQEFASPRGRPAWMQTERQQERLRWSGSQYEIEEE